MKHTTANDLVKLKKAVDVHMSFLMEIRSGMIYFGVSKAEQLEGIDRYIFELTEAYNHIDKDWVENIKPPIKPQVTPTE